MESRHVKSVNIDERSNKRIKFASAKERAKRASADVYRSHKRKIGATSATTREEAVHNPHREINARKRQRAHHLPVGDDRSKVAVLNVADQDELVETGIGDESEVLDITSSLASELDETLDRNASEIFGKFHRQVWPLVRSLPEILHHSAKIVDSMLSHVLSAESSPEVPSDLKHANPRGYVVNYATLDILHLMAVLARDLRHEIHPFLHNIVRRIVYDLLNPPPPPPESGKQPIPLDVTVVEAAFRCMSYIFRYDADLILEDVETMRKYYGATLAARRELVRRLAAETFAPLIRKIKSHNDRHRHLKRVLKALVAATEGQPLTPHLKRTQQDAVDGISQFLFQVVRGVPGHLHSQGMPTVQFVFTYCAKSPTSSNDMATTGSDLLLSIATTFLERLCRHLDDSTSKKLVEMLAGILNASLTAEIITTSGIVSALNALKLLNKFTTIRHGSVLRTQTGEELAQVYDSLDRIFSDNIFATLSLAKREEILSLATPIWITLQAHERFESRLRFWLRVIFHMDAQKNKSVEQQALSTRNMTAILSRDLIPFMKSPKCLDDIASITLSAAARVAEFDQDSALLAIFALATKRHDDVPPSCEPNTLFGECLFFSGRSAAYNISSDCQKKLLATCFLEVSKSRWDETLVKRLIIALRCASFIAFLPTGTKTNKDVFTKPAKWYADVLKAVDKDTDCVQHTDAILIKALALEGISQLASDFLVDEGDVSVIQKTMKPLIACAETLLFENPTSLWAVRGVSAFVLLLRKVNLRFNDKVDETFDTLVPNLCSPSHSLRLNTLQILAAFPLKSFVSDHADLDLKGDLDEEPSSRPQKEDTGNSANLVGQCDVINTLLQIESMKVQLTQERPLLGLISRVEVLGRSGKLPVHYAEAAAHHMLGLYYVKFAPLWPVVSNALVALAKGQENIVWPALETKLVSVMQAPSRPAEDIDTESNDMPSLGFHEHHQACILWEKSYGRSISIFGEPPAVQDGEVYRHLTTDDGTVMESVWQVAEKCQHLVAKHSRVIVPSFLGFLTDQYFFFHSDDPSARELDLNEPNPASSVDRGLLHKHELQKKLLCFLRAFSVVEGPHQLFQHQLLEKIFKSFLTHQETSIVQLGLTCLLKFKPKHLVPYRDLLNGILEKGRLRNALLKFEEAIEGEKIEKDHLKLLIPVLSRILFGRLSVRESRSGKDSPAARRSAILSFLSQVCQDDEEIFYFVYLMIRSFIPRSTVAMKEIEAYTEREKKEIMLSLHSLVSDDFDLPSGVIEGFLHLLQPVIAQLGHRIKNYVPTVTSLVVALCRVVAVVGSVENAGSDIEIDGRDDQRPVDGLRRGAIRTLCYQRLSEIFSMYARAIDFEKYSNQLWNAIGESVVLLPEMVVKSEKVPALLHLLETLSCEVSLMRILCSHEPAVSSVIKCIAGTSYTAVMNSVLVIIENLLEQAIESSDTKVRDIFGSNVNLLMGQFAIRLRTSDDSETSPEARLPLKRSRMKLRQSTWRKELQILCRISELVGQDCRFQVGDNRSVTENLTELLLPFLEPGQGTTDEDKLNVLGILRGTFGSLQPRMKEIAFGTLSDILGPSKGKSGMESITLRNEVSRLIEILGSKNSSIAGIANKVTKLNAINSKRIDELDFETIIPELNELGSDDAGCQWEVLSVETPNNLSPLVSTCFHYLHNQDGVLARASFNALKTLISVSWRKCRENDLWTKLIESVVVPPTRSGLQARSASIRRFYVLVIRETAKCFKDHPSPNLCGDLSSLIDEDNPDLDFFIGITHVQIHRRARAFQRLRKTLAGMDAKSTSLSSQSLSTILLPLALHPAYECKMKVEESFALEGIATVGAIARLLPWNKYHNTVWSILSSFDRHPEQERYLVGALCAIIDAFGFDLVLHPDPETAVEPMDTGEYEKTAVWRALERRIVPKIEGFLTKEKTEKNGTKTKLIRPPVVLALMKLFQKFPEHFFESKLPHILTIMCDALRNKDSDARDLARTTMGKIVTGMDLKYLADVVRELTITLNEGYKLHVRAAVIHTILQELQTVYVPPNLDAAASNFDFSIPAIMDILQEDLFGEANERRESQETNVRYVKEAGGSKSVHSIEILCKLIRFKPSDASNDQISKSSVHCVVGPLLERLRMSDISTSTIRKIKEILTRVVSGLSHNPSLEYEELFPFVYATIQPFVDSQLISAVFDEDEDDADGGLLISGSQKQSTKHGNHKSGKVVEWRPSTLKHVQSSKAAVEAQQKERQELRRVKDGANAPKLTGSARHGNLNVSTLHSLDDPATVSAVIFGLNLLHACLKKLNFDGDKANVVAMMDPFVPMLTACVCNCKDNEVALIAMKCLMSFLRFKLPSLDRCSKSLGTQALTFLSSGGTSLNQNNDMTQACFRTLTYLINRDREDTSDCTSSVGKADGEEVLGKNATMPLNGEQMKVLIGFLTVSISESDQHNPALGLIKAILSRKFMSPEFYDLMETMLKLNVRSLKASLRQQSAGIFLRYLLDYPMSELRFEQHLKQIVANISYEYQEGRLSAIDMLLSAIEKLPDALLERHAQLLFLPQVLQLVNDDTKECREAVSKCLSTLLARCTTDVRKNFHNYTVRWCDGQGPMKIASLQVFCIFVESCREFILSCAREWVERLHNLLQNSTQDWEVTYFSLIGIEKLSKLDQSLVLTDLGIWKCIIDRLIDSHPWIKLASCRIVKFLVGNEESSSPMELSPGLLFEIVRNLCLQLNVDEEEQSEDLSEMAIKTLTLTLPIVKQRPELCFEPDSPHAGLRDPVAWLLRRLAAIAKPKGRRRRIGVYKAFAAFCNCHSNIVLSSQTYLELILEPLHRSHIEASNETDNPAVLHKGTTEEEMTESSLARDVLQLIEEGSPSTEFLQAYAAVKTRASDRKEQRKTQAKAEVVQDPMGAALKKSKKHDRERQRKKRRVDDRRRDRGAQKKQRHHGP